MKILKKIIQVNKPKLSRKEIMDLEMKSIIKLNKKFQKATPSEKRIIIAQDVISQIVVGKFIPTKGGYFSSKNDLKGDLQTCIIKPGFKCEVCEIGGLFTSLIKIENNFKMEDIGYIDNKHMEERLKKYFSEEQLALVESAFEASDFSQNNINDIKLQKAIDYRERKRLSKPEYSFGKQWLKECKTKDREAMIAICTNIINNKGTFRPER